jgi:hypothetical protein
MSNAVTLKLVRLYPGIFFRKAVIAFVGLVRAIRIPDRKFGAHSTALFG